MAMFCSDVQAPLFFLFSSEVPPLLYYSHFFALISSLVVGLFVYFSNRGSLAALLLFLSSIFFSAWTVMDIMLWVNTDSRIIIFVWSMINLVEALVSILTLYFTYVFFEKHDAPFWAKHVMVALLLPMALLMHTSLNVGDFDLVSCEPQQGPLLFYFYSLEVLVSSWLLIYLYRRFRKTSGRERIQVLWFGIGATLFLFSFSGTNIIASITENWKILQYGLFGAPVFTSLLAFLIVKYRAFDIKLVGAQALVVAQLVLIGSMFFFTRSLSNHILVALTLIITLGIGWSLIRSVRKEVARKEELQMISDSLASANERLRRLDNAKSEFISIASHQLRTPLTAIKGYVSLILEGSYGKVSAEVEDVLEKVYGVQGQLAQLVEDLLNVSRIESGRIQYQFAPARLEIIITDLVDMFSITAKDKGIALKMHLSKKALPQLTIDAGKIKETISNLIDNAVKYTPQGGEVRVLLEGDEERRMARVIVEDTGVGISPEDKERLFEKFVRSKETTKMVTSGTGLGLYVGKNFVEAHGGRIWAESEGQGQGARFIMELPYEYSAAGRDEVATFGKSYEGK